MTRHPTQWAGDYDGRLEAMINLSHAAAHQTLSFFGDSNLQIDRKGDATPVTQADRSAEQLIRNELADAFGDDSILGEEFGETGGRSGYRWIIDPIDGTKSFICGVPLYSTLIGLEHGDQMIGGVIVIPALGESIVAAADCGAWHRTKEDQPWNRASVSSCENISDAVFVTSQVDLFAQRNSKAYETIQSAASITRSWGDGYGYLLVATGRAEIMLDPVVCPWDVAAVAPVIAESGGRFADWSGANTIRGGDALGTNAQLFEQVLKILV